MENKKNKKDWYIVDAKGQILGRLASKISKVLYGKNKVNFMPNLDMGDYVVVINAKEVKVTGSKLDNKIYYRHTGYPGGIKSETLGKLKERSPEEIIFKAVRGMLPKNKLSRGALKRLRIYKDEEYPQNKDLKELKW